MPEQIKPENINSSFFDGYYKEIWRSIFPEKTTIAEAEWIINEAQVTSDNSVLDLMCGYGRHSLEIARKGIHVTAIDNLPEYINEIKEKATYDNLLVEAICTDVLQMELTKEFDVAMCMGNSLQFFNEQDLLQLLLKVSAHLKPGGKFFINTWSIAEIALKNFKEKSWSRFGDMLFFTDSKLLFHPTRMVIDSVILKDSGEREEKTGIDYIYSINEIETMLNKTGFQLKEVYSIPVKKLFTVGDPRAYLVAEKIS